MGGSRTARQAPAARWRRPGGQRDGAVPGQAAGVAPPGKQYPADPVCPGVTAEHPACDPSHRDGQEDQGAERGQAQPGHQRRWYCPGRELADPPEHRSDTQHIQKPGWLRLSVSSVSLGTRRESSPHDRDSSQRGKLRGGPSAAACGGSCLVMVAVEGGGADGRPGRLLVEGPD
jgi:hypothetical protein